MNARRQHRRSCLVLALALAGCDSAASLDTRVFAPSSLREIFEATIEGNFSRTHFAGTPRLVLQLREGARADVFVSADRTNMKRVVEAELAAGRPRVIARNRLAIVVAPRNPKKVRSLSDLARADLRVALCAPQVPAGRYARRALDKARVDVRSLSDEPNVKALLHKVQLGELDAGIVYKTDILAAHERVDGITIADEHNVLTEYSAVALASRLSPSHSDLVLEYFESEDFRRELAKSGFELP